MSANPSSPERAPFVPNYSLEQPELLDLERQMAEYTQDVQRHAGVHALLIDPTHPFSNFIRTQEEIAFPGAGSELSLEAELDTKQMALIDTRSKSQSYGKITFVSTVSGYRNDRHSNEKTTGVVAVDELIDIPENNLTADDFKKYCLAKGVDPHKILGVETSIKLVDGMQRYHLLRTTQLAYLTVFNLAELMNPAFPGQDLESAAVARVNQSTQVSTGRTNVKSEILMNRTDWVTPESALAEPFSVVMYTSRGNRLISGLRRIAPNIIEIGA